MLQGTQTNLRAVYRTLAASVFSCQGSLVNSLVRALRALPGFSPRRQLSQLHEHWPSHRQIWSRAQKSEAGRIAAVAEMHQGDAVKASIDDFQEPGDQIEPLSRREIADKHGVLERRAEAFQHPAYKAETLRMPNVVRNKMSRPTHLIYLVTIGR